MYATWSVGILRAIRSAWFSESPTVRSISSIVTCDPRVVAPTWYSRQSEGSSGHQVGVTSRQSATSGGTPSRRRTSSRLRLTRKVTSRQSASVHTPWG